MQYFLFPKSKYSDKKSTSYFQCYLEWNSIELNFFWIEPQWMKYCIDWKPTEFNVIDWNLGECSVFLTIEFYWIECYGMEPRWIQYYIEWNPTEFNVLNGTSVNQVLDWKASHWINCFISKGIPLWIQFYWMEPQWIKC